MGGQAHAGAMGTDQVGVANAGAATLRAGRVVGSELGAVPGAEPAHPSLSPQLMGNTFESMAGSTCVSAASREFQASGQLQPRPILQPSLCAETLLPEPPKHA